MIGRVRHLLLVPFAVGHFFEDEPMSLVERAGSDIGLEGLEPKIWLLGLSELDQTASNPLPVMVRIDVEMIDPSGRERDMTDQ
jgi:hypothetical protein